MPAKFTPASAPCHLPYVVILDHEKFDKVTRADADARLAAAKIAGAERRKRKKFDSGRSA